jgi:tRNA-specific 2-thiouridylase
VLNENGEVIGVHEGAALYTIGQRHGFSTEKQGPSDTPYFVISKDMKMNTITVTHRDPAAAVGGVNAFLISDVISRGDGILSEDGLSVRIRYRGALHPAGVSKEHSTFKVELGKSVGGIAVGQSAVFYRGAECVGGGIVTEVGDIRTQSAL